MSEPRVIDLHAHFFPDHIAAGTVTRLAREANMTVFGDGSRAALERFAAEDGVALSVNLPVATRPEQVPGINARMIAENARGGPVRCFGAMHPAFPAPAAELARLAAAGIRGIKLHPEYQGFYPDDPLLVPVYEACAALGLIVVFHAGRDPGFSDVHGTPRRLRQVLAVEGLEVVLAHLGGWEMWDEVAAELVGTRAILDTSYCGALPEEELRALIRAHGTDRVAFGSDFPWVRAAPQLARLAGLGLTADELADLHHRTAARLLG